MSELEHGRVEYTGRAFDEDAQERMAGQIENALVELMTNPDDSYIRLQARGSRGEGTIRVEVEHRRKGCSKVIVRDRAEGMTADEMRQKLTRLGARTAGQSEGMNVRGSRGRGAKDVVAFGPCVWESIKDDRYYYFKLHPSGDYDLDPKGRKATPDDRQKLGITRGNGTMVALEVDSARFRGSIPQHETLAKRLVTHYRLRNIMTDETCRVTLKNLNTGEASGALRYRYPEEFYKATPALDEQFETPGYPDASAVMKVWRHKDRFSEDKRSPYRQGGILVTSGRDIHEITLFDFEKDPYAEWFFGVLEVRYIRRLCSEYDDRREKGQHHPESNPFSILRVDHSLNSDHPFTKALAAAAQERLARLVGEERQREEGVHARIESAENKARLKRLATAASRFMAEKLKEFDELPPVGPGYVVPNGFAIVPPVKRITLGHAETMSVLLEEPSSADPVGVQLTVDNPGISLDPVNLTLTPHARRPDILSGTFRVRGLTTGALGVILARVDGRQPAESIVEVVPPEPPPPAPNSFCFEREHYRIVYGKEKTVNIFAPQDVVSAHGEYVQLSADHPDIVIRRQTVRLRLNGDLGWYIGATRLQGRQLHATGKIYARLGALQTESRVRVVERDDEGGFPLEFHVDNEYYGNLRAIWKPRDSYTLSIAGKHESVGRYLGPAEEGFPGDESAHFRLLLAEIVAESVCERLLTIQGEKKGQDWARDMDVDAFYTEHHRYMGEFITTAHKVLLSPTDLKRLRNGPAS